MTIRFLGLMLILSLAISVSTGCPTGDLNGDCRVDTEDLTVFAEQWLDATCAGAPCADLNGVNGVNATDFALLAEHWLQDGGGIALVINELMAENHGFVRDAYGDNDDWIEIYNTGDDAVNIGGMYLTDNLSAPT
ncbi:MAG: hypothetical protein JSU70_21000 [Phycisphaerales bacterium]|nr:MAG: hypothetical protein JSU70_21000 [Phycisphaerales bacterium]